MKDFKVLMVEIAKLELKPSDTLVVRLPLHLMRYQDLIVNLIKKAFLKQKTLILMKDIGLEVVK